MAWALVFLDLSERLDELAPAIDAILSATWCRTVNGEEAAFSTYRDNIECDRSFPYNLDLRAVIAAVLLAAFSVLSPWPAPEELPAV